MFLKIGNHTVFILGSRNPFTAPSIHCDHANITYMVYKAYALVGRPIIAYCKTTVLSPCSWWALTNIHMLQLWMVAELAEKCSLTLN